jgi:hypothetical protein
MREVGEFSKKQEARRLGDCLCGKGIANDVEEEGGKWTVWVHDDDQLAQAESMHDAFRVLHTGRQYTADAQEENEAMVEVADSPLNPKNGFRAAISRIKIGRMWFVICWILLTVPFCWILLTVPISILYSVMVYGNLSSVLGISLLLLFIMRIFVIVFRCRDISECPIFPIIICHIPIVGLIMFIHLAIKPSDSNPTK